MKLKILITAILLFSVTYFFAQENSDIVYLNNGSMIKGNIIEYFANDHITIKTEENKTYNFPASDIKQINSSNIEKERKDTWFFNNTSLGVLIGKSNDYNSMTNFTFNMVNGYQFNNNLQVGLGLGFDVINRNIYLPFYADMKYFVRSSSLSPYVGISGGYSLQTTKSERSNIIYYDYYQNYNTEAKNSNGLMAGFEFGIRNYTKSDFGYLVSAGYRFQYLTSTYNDWQYPNVEVLEQHYIHRFKLTVGILFN
ncbi:MAG: hypothetical protein GXO79_09130 [Chlorobi bacterium]|nr:hypothetical protein [Chlorobiota bacterium]